MSVYDTAFNNASDNSDLPFANDPVGNAFNVKRGNPVKVNTEKWFMDLESYTVDTLLRTFMNSMVIKGIDATPSYVIMCYLLGEFIGRVRCANNIDDIDYAFKLIFDMCDEIAKRDSDLVDDAFDYVKVGLNKYLYELKKLCKEAAKS